MCALPSAAAIGSRLAMEAARQRRRAWARQTLGGRTAVQLAKLGFEGASQRTAPRPAQGHVTTPIAEHVFWDDWSFRVAIEVWGKWFLGSEEIRARAADRHLDRLGRRRWAGPSSVDRVSVCGQSDCGRLGTSRPSRSREKGLLPHSFSLLRFFRRLQAWKKAGETLWPQSSKTSRKNTLLFSLLPCPRVSLNLRVACSTAALSLLAPHLSSQGAASDLDVFSLELESSRKTLSAQGAASPAPSEDAAVLHRPPPLRSATPP